MAEKIELVVYRHKERKDLYLTRNWSYCGGISNGVKGCGSCLQRIDFSGYYHKGGET